MAKSYKIHCSVCTGFEKVALEEAKEKLEAKEIPPQMEKDSRGRIVIEVSDANVHRLRELRTVDSLYVIAKEYLDIEFSKDKKAAIEQLEELVPDFGWQTGLEVWRKYFSFEHPISLSPQSQLQTHDSTADDTQLTENGTPPTKRSRANPKLPGFRCTCHRTGDEHSFQSMEVAATVGGRIQDYFGWNVDLKNHEIEIVLFVEDKRVRVCWALTRSSLHRRNLVDFGPTALRATVSAGLIRYAGGVVPGQIVCDPMCGSGSIPIEAAEATPQALHLCGDIHEKACNRVLTNLEAYAKQHSKDLPINSVRWDITSLPLRSGCVDLFVVDLPFGKRSGSKFDNRKLYPAALKEMARVAVPETGRACLLTQDRKNIIRTISEMKQFWKLTRQSTANIGGLFAGVFLLTRTLNAIS